MATYCQKRMWEVVYKKFSTDIKPSETPPPPLPLCDRYSCYLGRKRRRFCDEHFHKRDSFNEVTLDCLSRGKDRNTSGWIRTLIGNIVAAARRFLRTLSEKGLESLLVMQASYFHSSIRLDSLNMVASGAASFRSICPFADKLC